jgi:RNA polymerase sigma-70 factor (ECF subfamily)
VTTFDDQLHDRFLRLFTVSEPAVRAFVRRLVPLRDDARDVMQEVALVLWQKFGGYTGGGDEDFRRWAFGVARFEVLAWRRDLARDRHVFHEDLLEVLADDSAQTNDRLELQREALRSCLAKLRSDQQRLVLAAYGPGASIREIAARSGRTVAAFYQWLHRVRFSLLSCVRKAVAKET